MIIETVCPSCKSIVKVTANTIEDFATEVECPNCHLQGIIEDDYDYEDSSDDESYHIEWC